MAAQPCFGCRVGNVGSKHLGCRLLLLDQKFLKGNSAACAENAHHVNDPAQGLRFRTIQESE